MNGYQALTALLWFLQRHWSAEEGTDQIDLELVKYFVNILKDSDGFGVYEGATNDTPWFLSHKDIYNEWITHRIPEIEQMIKENQD